MPPRFLCQGGDDLGRGPARVVAAKVHQSNL